MNVQTMQSLAGALGGFVDHPVARMAKKYWYLSVPLGLGLYGKMRERYEKGGKFHQYLSDASTIFGPVLTIVAVFELAEKMEGKGKLGPVAEQMAATAKEADYTVQQQETSA